jgi:hypothetical protein
VNAFLCHWATGGSKFANFANILSNNFFMYLNF